MSRLLAFPSTRGRPVYDVADRGVSRDGSDELENPLENLVRVLLQPNDERLAIAPFSSFVLVNVEVTLHHGSGEFDHGSQISLDPPDRVD